MFFINPFPQYLANTNIINFGNDGNNSNQIPSYVPLPRCITLLITKIGNDGNNSNHQREKSMNKTALGILSGIIFGGVSVLTMIPLEFADRRRAMPGAFVNRFSIGFVSGTSTLAAPRWLQGLIFGFLLSLPDAIITKALAPILGLGTPGGSIIGLIIGKWGK